MVKAFYSDTEKRADAYGLLRFAYERLCGDPCPEIEKTAEGKPFFPSRPGVHFSISHTQGRVMVCIADGPCGCDTQLIRPVRENVLRRVCADGELADFDFFELWAMKESFIKLRGVFIPYREMPFRRADGLIRAPDPAVHTRLYPAPGFMSAVCALEPPEEELIFVPPKNLI